ncbi:hypothetical protein OG588_21845 [Streptomyces prunicolor]|uniref:hypothetical protein n=1 Tax=Streptomyces prunicolor TaxID=67348 RepID=UPI003863DB69|nr:hypothetical protein OG588_21845 [Streptomyces prunicolor]
MNWVGGATIACTPAMLEIQYDQWVTDPDGVSHYIAAGDCVECSSLVPVNTGYSCVQEANDCSGVWLLTKESVYVAPPGTTWTSATSGCEISGQTAVCQKTVTAGTAYLFNNTQPVRCTATVTSGCVNLPSDMQAVPHLTDKSISDIYTYHYTDDDTTAAAEKSTFLAGTTPSKLQKIFLYGLNDNTSSWQLNEDGYYQKRFVYTAYVGSTSALNGAYLTQNVLVSVSKISGDVITMFPE